MTSAKVTAGYTSLLGLLVVIIYSEDHSVLVPLVVLSGVGLVVCLTMTILQRRWTAWLAVAYSLIAGAGDDPHQILEIFRPHSAGHTIGAAILLGASVAALAIAIRTATVRSSDALTA